jgi:predicted RecB family nuclease
MQRVGNALIFSPSDLHHFLECRYLTRLDLEVVNGRVLEKRRGPEADLLAAKGEAHERGWVGRFRDEGRALVEIPDPGAQHDWSAAADATVRAMRTGADVIYQAVLMSDGWRGRADFLVRVDVPSALGPWSYEVWDTKLARHARPAHVLQLAYYSGQVAAIQQIEPEWMRLALGSGEEAAIRTRDVSAYFRAVRRKFLRAVQESEPADPYPVSHCGLCGYTHHCDERWDDEDHLSLVSNIRRSQVLVEVKLSSDSRIRREVVGQMLDYAANAVAYWPVEMLRAQFTAGCDERGEDPAEVVSAPITSDQPEDVERFWAQVKTNLQAGRVRLVLATKSLPSFEGSWSF